MCDAIALSLRELPAHYHQHSAIRSRLMGRGGDEEVQFFYDRKPYPPLLPIILEDQFRIVRWGNRQRHSKVLPWTGRVEIQDVEQGCWQNIDAQEVVIVASAALHRGVWFPILQGIRGLFVIDEKKVPTVFMLMGEPTDYYRIMTKSKTMPLLVDDIV
ncbi:MAG: hypothetical protein QM703_15310 [Gemmatales bacterium]